MSNCCGFPDSDTPEMQNAGLQQAAKLADWPCRRMVVTYHDIRRQFSLIHTTWSGRLSKTLSTSFMRYRLSTLLLLVLCIALGVAWHLASYSNADKNHLSNIWYDQTGSVILLTFDTDGLFTNKEYAPSSELQYTQHDGKYEIQNDTTVVMTIESSRDYSWNGGDD